MCKLKKMMRGNITTVGKKPSGRSVQEGAVSAFPAPDSDIRSLPNHAKVGSWQ